MSIDEAIEFLQRERESGTQHIILAFWKAEEFRLVDDITWGRTADYVHDKMDWSSTSDRLAELVEEVSTEA